MFKTFPSTFLTFTILIATIHQATLANGLNLNLKPTSGNLSKYVELGQALKYGDACFWEAEEYRQNFTRDMINAGTPNAQKVVELADSIVERNYSLCSAAKLYVCDKESQKCVCGTAIHVALMGVNRSLFTLEGTDKCRWNTGTYCIGEDQMAQMRQEGFTVDSKCKTGTSCKISDEKGKPCSAVTSVVQLIHNLGLMALFDVKRVAEEILSGRVCSCKFMAINIS